MLINEYSNKVKEAKDRKKQEGEIHFCNLINIFSFL